MRRVIRCARVVAAIDEEDGANLGDASRNGLVALSAAVHSHIVLVVAGGASYVMVAEVAGSLRNGSSQGAGVVASSEVAERSVGTRSWTR